MQAFGEYNRGMSDICLGKESQETRKANVNEGFLRI